MKKWVIFDVMGVIFEVGDDTNDLLIPYIKKLDNNISSEQINDLYIDASLGKITSYNFWERLGFKSDYPQVEINYLDQYLTFDKDFLVIAEELKKEFNLALLSNDVSEWSSYLRKKYDLNKYLKEIVISGDVGYRKPSEEIYNLTLKRIGCNANDCVFVDDRYKNLIPAMKIGMKTIKFIRENMIVDKYKGFDINCFHQLPEVLLRVFSN